MTFENFSKEGASKNGFAIGNPGDLAQGLFHSAVENPWNGIAELTNLPQLHISDYNQHSLLGGAGDLIGMTADFVVLSKGANLGLSVIGKTAVTESLIGSTAKMSGIGALYGAVLTPGTDRLKAGLTDALTFGTMGGAAHLLQGEAAGLAGKVKVGVISGGAGGATRVAASLGLGFDEPKSLGDAIATVGQYAAVGALSGAIGHSMSPGVGRGAEKISKISISAEHLSSDSEKTIAGMAQPATPWDIGATSIDYVNKLLGRGVSFNRYIDSHPDLLTTKSPTFDLLLKEAPSARVLERPGPDQFVANKNRIEIAPGENLAARLGHEIEHHFQVQTGQSETNFQRAAALLKNDPEQSWQIYRSARLNEEAQARDVQTAIANELHSVEPLQNNTTIPEMKGADGYSYEQRWRSDFAQFAASGGTERPTLYAGDLIVSRGQHFAESMQTILASHQARVTAAAGSFVIAEQGAVVRGQPGSKVTARNGGFAIGEDGSSLIAQSGGSVLAKKGCTVRGYAGATIYKHPGAILIESPGATIVNVAPS